MAKYLLSLPPNLVDKFHELTGYSKSEWYCTSDPIGRKLGSGGGTVWLLNECYKSECDETDFRQWVSKEKRILMHAGGQSRRLPSYAPSGKVLTPIPIFRWKRGQRIDQNLLSLQMPLYEEIMSKTPKNLNTLIASGDVYIRATKGIGSIPDADVVCYGLWVEPNLAKNHGVFMMNRKTPRRLDYMLQKPTTEQLAELTQTHFFLMDIGVWILSDRAVEVLRNKCLSNIDGEVTEYDLYGTFGCALGSNPSKEDDVLRDLSVEIVPLNGGEFYHYGTSAELISSTTAIQNLVKDQRFIIQREVKRQPSVFTQNTKIDIKALAEHNEIWIENSHISSNWKLQSKNIITGVPQNSWDICLKEGQCIDVVPIGEREYVVRPYGYNDHFRGKLSDENTYFIGQPFNRWISERQLYITDFENIYDLQVSNIFPISQDIELLGRIVKWMIGDSDEDMKEIYLSLPRISADEISNIANLRRLEKQRSAFRESNLESMLANYSNSVFYQTDLKQSAKLFADGDLSLPKELPNETPIMTRIHDSMFRSEYKKNKQEDYSKEHNKAFSLLSEGIVEQIKEDKQSPTLAVCSDQIVWGRCPVRIDLAGGWTDTPPYSLTTGGNVVNMSILLNGQPPLQVYIKPSKELAIICRSIDLGAQERIETYQELATFNKVGSPFSIPKAALALCGFLPQFSTYSYNSLQEQLKDFGSGIEITLLSAIPAGSGLGTSSILASTVLGALSDFCYLGWDNMQIGNRTLILEQLLTTGGGWQDQYGGILQGVKLLQTSQGFDQTPIVRWLPNNIFTDGDYPKCHLLYYTGITRTAKNILTEIVRGMFLNSGQHLELLDKMKNHAIDMHDAILKGEFENYGKLIKKTWNQNKQLDSGTEPDNIKKLCALIDDLCLGYKLPGAGGGGYLYMVAKDTNAAMKIRQLLADNPITYSARFVDMSLSKEGLQISRS